MVAALVPLAVIPVFFVMRGVRSLTTTLRSQYLNDRIESAGRATVLSAASMVFALTAATTRQVGGAVADATSPLTMVGLFAGLFLVAALALLRAEPPVAAGTGLAAAD